MNDFWKGFIASFIGVIWGSFMTWRVMRKR